MTLDLSGFTHQERQTIPALIEVYIKSDYRNDFAFTYFEDDIEGLKSLAQRGYLVKFPGFSGAIW